MIKLTAKLIFLSILAGLIGCAVPAYQSMPSDAAAAVATADRLVAQETSAANLATATAAHGTRQAEVATAQAQATATMEATQTEAAIAAQNTAVYRDLEVEQTRASIEITRLFASAQATAAQAREEISQEALRIENEDYQSALQIQRQREALAIQRQATINKAIPWLYGAGFVLFLFVLAAVGFILYRRLNPKILTPYPANFGQTEDQRLSISGPALPLPFVIADGLGILQIPMSARSQATEAPLAIEATTPINLSDHGSFNPGHYLIAGETRAGKGTLARFILKDMNINKIAIDPHYQAGNWPGVSNVIGAARNFDQIAEFLNGYMIQELDKRAQDMARDHTAVWPPIMVIMDEAPAIKSALGSSASNVWASWLREGWKFDLYLMLITQSTRVKTLGIEGEGDVLRNFVYRFALGEVALQEFPGVADHLERPAIILGKRGPRPVIIPHITAEDIRQQERPQIAVKTPLFTAPAPSGVNTSKGYVTEAEAAKILSMDQAGESWREIERQVFGVEKGKEGGANYYKVKEVIEKRSATANGVHIGALPR